MDSKDLKKYKEQTVIVNENNPNQRRIIKYRKNRKPSIDMREEVTIKPGEFSNHVTNERVNQDGSITVNHREVMIDRYEEKLYSMLNDIGLPTDNTVKYKADGTVIPLSSNSPDEYNFELIGYLLSDKFNKVPNVTRIATLLSTFKTIRTYFENGDYERACNSLSCVIGEYTAATVVSLESFIVPHSNSAGNKAKTAKKKNKIHYCHERAKELLKINPKLTKTAIAKKIADEKGWASSYIRQKYLADFQI